MSMSMSISSSDTYKFIIKNFLLSKIICILLIITYYHILNIGKSDLSSNIYIQYEKNSINPNQILDNLSITEKYSILLLKNFFSYDSIHFIHIAINDYTHIKNLAFFPLFPFLIRSIASIIQTYFDFQMKITSYLLSGFMISNAFSLINTVLLYVFLSKIIKNDNFHKENTIKLSILLFLYNPGSIFNTSIYTESIFIFFHLILLLYLINNRIDNLLSLNGIIGLSTPICLSISLRSNSILLVIYALVPLLGLVIKENKECLIENENEKKPVSVLKIIGNLLKKSKVKLIKVGFLLVFSLVSFIFFTKINSKNVICNGILHKIHNFKREQLKNNQNSEFIWNQTVIKNSVSGDYYDISNDSNYEFCVDLDGKYNDLYSFIQKTYWKSGFLNQFRLFPSNLDRLLFSLPMNILSILYILCYLTRFFSLKSIFEYDFLGFFQLKPLKPLKPSYNEEYFIHLKLIYFSSTVYHLFLVVLIIFFGHWQINNRLLTTSPLFFLFLSEYSSHFNEELLNLKTNSQSVGDGVDVDVDVNKRNGLSFKFINVFIILYCLGIVLYVGGYSYA